MGEIETASQIRNSEEMEENTNGNSRSDRQRGERQQSSTRGIPSTPMVDINSNEIFLSDYQDKILILHFLCQLLTKLIYKYCPDSLKIEKAVYRQLLLLVTI